MVLLGFVLQHMRSGARLIVIGSIDGSDSMSTRNIRQVFLMSPSGKQEKLPVALFLHIYPHLVEIERNEQRIVYRLDET